jgi:hypothetical protein
MSALPRDVTLLRSPVWLLGLAFTVAAFALETQALALADVTVVKLPRGCNRSS